MLVGEIIAGVLAARVVEVAATYAVLKHRSKKLTSVQDEQRAKYADLLEQYEAAQAEPEDAA